ncbi:MAG: RidA family protein [Emcibacteraceae bacterium]|nr:RidA family protein [Emcibacteraceae bacterium]MDG1996740.1 RidA family protein [Emcibacteraceae bacterium]
MSKLFKIAIAAFAAMTMTANAQSAIERNDEGRHFYSTIEVPAHADQLFVSGNGPGAINEDAKGVAKYGSTEEQARSTFTKIKGAVEKAGWSMSDIVMVRVFLVADPEMGKMDFSGFNVAYREFFGTEENPNKPVRAVVEISGLAVDGWLVEIDVRGARMMQPNN